MLSREQIVGGFSGGYPVLKAMEESGRIRRGYFVAGLGAAQFASPGADDRLRAAKAIVDEKPNAIVLAATDPANAYGNVLPWPETKKSARPQRAPGAKVVLWDGQLIGYLSRTQKTLMTFLPLTDPERAGAIQQLVTTLASIAKPGHSLLLTKIDGDLPSKSVIESNLRAAGFMGTTGGYLHTGR